MKTVFSRIATAIVATASVAASALVFAPAASATPAPSAVVYEGYMMSQQIVGTQANPSTDTPVNSMTLPLGATSMSQYVAINFGTDLAKSIAGHTIRIEWNNTFPAGVNWWTPQTPGISRGATPYAQGGFGFTQTDWDEINFRATSDDVADPAGSSLVNIPSRLSTATAGQGVKLMLSVNAYNQPAAGTYSWAPVLFDKTAGTAITLAPSGDFSYSSTNSNIATSDQVNWTYEGSGQFLGDVPAGAYVTQQAKTCVAKADLVDGHRIELTRMVNGAASTAPMYGGTTIFEKGSTSYTGRSFSPTYTVVSSDVDSSAKGFRVPQSIQVDNSTGSQALNVSSTSLVIKDIDASTPTEIQSSCAAETPAAPTFTLNGRSDATVTWTKISSEGVNQWNQSDTEYMMHLYKSSDPSTPVISTELNGTLTGSTYSASAYFTSYYPTYTSYQADANTDYFITITAKNMTDSVVSAESAASATSQLVGPQAPTNVTLDLTTLSNATITWTPSTGDSGSGFNYSYEIYTAADQTTPVRSGGLFAQLSNGSYSATISFTNPMTPWIPEPLTSNTNYVAKVRAHSNSLGLDSAWSAASAPDSISGPAAPNKPVITAITSNSVTATLAIRAGETSFMYSARVYASTDSSFTTLLGSGACSGVSSPYTCNIMASGSTTFSSATTYVVVATAMNNSIESSPSAASDPMAGPLAGVTFSSPVPSQGTADGKAKTISTSVPWITSSFTSMGQSQGRIIGDGKGNIYAWNDAGIVFDNVSNLATGRKFELRKFKADSTGFDTSFGSMTLEVSGSTNPMNNSLPAISFFDGSNKVAVITNLNSTSTLYEATLGSGSGFSAGVILTQNLASYCTAEADLVFNYGYTNLLTRFEALSAPTAQVVCSSSGGVQSQRLAATIASDGTFTHLFDYHAISGTQNTLSSSTISSNPNATGSEVASVVYAVRSLNNLGAQSNYDRVIFRVKADGTVDTTTNALPTASSTSSMPSITMPAYNDGTTVHALVNTAGMYSLTTIPVASGTVGATTALATPMSSMSQLAFPLSSVPNVNGEIALVKTTQTGPSTIKNAPVRINASTGAVITGEEITRNDPTPALFYAYIDGAGHMNAVYTPATQGVNTHSVLQWKNVRSMTTSTTPNPPVVTPPSGNVPVYVSKDVTRSINGGGKLMTITGTDMNSNLITGVRFGTSAALPAIKAAATLKVVVPSAAVAGIANAPTVDEPETVPVSIVLSDGTSVSAGSVTYIGPSKLAQIITTVIDTALAYIGSPDRDLSVDNFTGISLLTPPVTPVLSPSSVCAIVAGKVQFLAPGKCTITTTSPGNDLLAPATDVKTITVAKQDQELSVSLDNEPAVVGEADRDIAVTNTTSLTPGAAVVPVLTPASVCTLVAGKVHFVGAGVCKVTSQAAATSVFNASAADIKLITVTKQNQELAVGLSTVAALVGEPDRAINITTATGLTPNSATITPVLTPASVCTLVAGSVHFVGPGVCTVTTKAEATSMFNASSVNVKKITVAKQSQELAVALSTATAFVGSPDRDVTVTNQTSLTPGAAVTPVLSPATVCTLVAGKVHFVGAGTCTVKSQAAGTSTFLPSAISTKTIKVMKQTQILSVSVVTTPAFVGEADRDISVTNTTSLTPGAAVTPVLSPATVCTLVAGKVHFVGPGICDIKSQAAGTTTFNASAISSKKIVVAKQSQRVVVTTATTPALIGDADRDITVVNTTSLTPGAAVTPVLTPASVCTLVAGKIHFVAPGTCVIKSQAAATTTFNASNVDTKSITVRRADAITVTPNTFVTDDSAGGFELPASTLSGRAITYTVSPASASVCSYDKTLRVIKGKSPRTSNTCSLTLSVAADATWSAASSVQTITISAAALLGTGVNNLLAVSNTNTAEGYKNMAFSWDRTSGDFKVSVSSVFVGPITAKISWTSGATTYTCTSASFGTTAAVTGAAITATKTVTSAGVCAGASQATKLAALKLISNTTPVKVEISRQLFDPKTYKLVSKVTVAPVYLTLAN